MYAEIWYQFKKIYYQINQLANSPYPTPRRAPCYGLKCSSSQRWVCLKLAQLHDKLDFSKVDSLKQTISSEFMHDESQVDAFYEF